MDERAGRPDLSKIPINGILRTGLATLHSALSLYEEFSDGHNEPFTAAPGAKSGHSSEDSIVVAELRAELATRDKIISDLRIKGKRVVADRNHWEAKAKTYEIEIATRKARAESDQVA